MTLVDKYNQIHLEVLKRIIPQREEKELLERKYLEISKKIMAILKNENIEAKVELTGSLSRDTWISGTRDIDIFVILPYESKLTSQELLNVLKQGIKLPWIKKHAKHPYLYARYEGDEIEIIPCYEYTPNRALRSPVDRSPYHKKFILENLPVGSNDEVRLLKQFMRGIGAYGAEIKIRGFSGYLLELLIIHFQGKFIDVLKNASKLINGEISFKKNLKIDRLQFEGDSLIVIDPTDDNRNVASALKEQSLINFLAAADNYLRTPSICYFFPKQLLLNTNNLEEMKKTALNFLAIFQKEPAIADDILWGQLRKFEKSILTFLQNLEVKPVVVDSIITNNRIMTVIITIESLIPSYYWQTGPPIDHVAQEEFLKKYLPNPSVIYGPTIINGRWMVLLKKEKETITEALKKAIEMQIIAQPSHLNFKEIEIITKNSLVAKIKNDFEKLLFLYKLIKGKPAYLDY